MDMYLHNKKIRYADLLHVTVNYNKYSIKEFFKKIEEEDIDIDPDSLIDGTDDTFADESYKTLVKLAKERIYPYRQQAEMEPDEVSAVPEKDPKIKVPDFSLSDAVSDVMFTVYDGFRRASIGMSPVDVKKPDLKVIKGKIQDKLPKKKKDGSEEEVADDKQEDAQLPVVVNLEGHHEEVNGVETTTMKQKIFVPVNGVVSNDVQEHFNHIFQEMKERVPKGTQIDVIYNNMSGSFTCKLTFEDKTNNLTIDAKTLLPDYYSIFVSHPEYGTIAVPFDDKIAQDIIETPMYKISKEDVERLIKKYYLEDIGVYYTFDFSTFKGMNKMSKKDKKKLNDILVKLSEDLKDQTVEDTPRFRISKFVSIDDFEITSDERCRSPLAYIHETSGWTANTVLEVKNGQAIRKQVA